MYDVETSPYHFNDKIASDFVRRPGRVAHDYLIEPPLIV